MYYYQNNTWGLPTNYVYLGVNEINETVTYSVESTTTTY